MVRFTVRMATIAVSVAVLGFGLGTASAQDCKEEVTASGNARPTEGWAKSLATNMWRRQVQATYGEQYEDIRYAKGTNYVCSPTSLGRRCTLTAVPCMVGTTPQGQADNRPRPPPDDDDYGSGRPGLARQLQRELKRVGCYDGSIDGDWGDGSRRALERFAKRMDMRLDVDEPSRKALQAVEDTAQRVCRER